MFEERSKLCTAFLGSRRIASGPLCEVVLVVKATMEKDAVGPVLTFDDATGHVVDLDIRGTSQEILARVDSLGLPQANHEAPKGRGRPRLGVVAREVTLLPRHWDWLNSQPGGASLALRKLVEEARRTSEGRDGIRHAQEAAYSFMSAIAGDEPGYEEALRALFSQDHQSFKNNTQDWPQDVRDHAHRLAGPALREN